MPSNTLFQNAPELQDDSKLLSEVPVIDHGNSSNNLESAGMFFPYFTVKEYMYFIFNIRTGKLYIYFRGGLMWKMGY
jgi:hypothetical protein